MHFSTFWSLEKKKCSHLVYVCRDCNDIWLVDRELGIYCKFSFNSEYSVQEWWAFCMWDVILLLVTTTACFKKTLFKINLFARQLHLSCITCIVISGKTNIVVWAGREGPVMKWPTSGFLVRLLWFAAIFKEYLNIIL